MKKKIYIFLGFIIGIVTSVGIGYFGIQYLVASWYAEARAKNRDMTYRIGGTYAKESVERGVFVKKLNFLVETDSLTKYFNETDTIFYIEKGFHEKKWGGTRILSERETNYPYQFIARDIDFDNQRIRFHYFKKDNERINDSISGSYYHQEIMLKKVQNDTIFLKIFLNETAQYPNAEKEVGIVKVFSN